MGSVDGWQIAKLNKKSIGRYLPYSSLPGSLRVQVSSWGPRASPSGYSVALACEANRRPGEFRGEKRMASSRRNRPCLARCLVPLSGVVISN